MNETRARRGGFYWRAPGAFNDVASAGFPLHRPTHFFGPTSLYRRYSPIFMLRRGISCPGYEYVTAASRPPPSLAPAPNPVKPTPRIHRSPCSFGFSLNFGGPSALSPSLPPPITLDGSFRSLADPAKGRESVDYSPRSAPSATLYDVHCVDCVEKAEGDLCL
jgi:hypothetical protein